MTHCLRTLLFSLLLLAILGACSAAETTRPMPGTATIPLLGSAQEDSPPPSTPVPSTPETTEPASAPRLPEEAILILQPAPGSRLTSPVTVAGIADSTFEQHLAVRILLDDGTQLALVPTLIQAELGQRGSFQVELDFTIQGERQAFIQVYADSPRDGQITHLSSTGVILSEAGPAYIRLAESRDERLYILRPAPGDLISGGIANIEGYGWAGFENTLLIEIHDQAGNILAQAPVTIASPEMGQSGPFQLELPYSISEVGAGRVVVSDISPAFGGDAHRSSVEIRLAP